MSCSTKIIADVVNKCQSVRGLKPLAYWAYKKDISFTFSDNTITGVWTDKLGIFEATKFGLNAGHEVVEFDDNGEQYKHKFSAVFNVKDINIDLLDDIVVFVQTNDGVWLAYGANFGLWKSSQGSMANDNNATVAIELSSRDGMGELYSEHIVTFDLATIIVREISLNASISSRRPVRLILPPISPAQSFV